LPVFAVKIETISVFPEKISVLTGSGKFLASITKNKKRQAYKKKKQGILLFFAKHPVSFLFLIYFFLIHSADTDYCSFSNRVIPAITL